jgi:hypothetical protein
MGVNNFGQDCNVPALGTGAGGQTDVDTPAAATAAVPGKPSKAPRVVVSDDRL